MIGRDYLQEREPVKGSCFSGKENMQDFARAFYFSKKWQDCRAGYINHRRSIDGGMCEECRSEPGFIVHHRVHLSPRNIADPEITLGWSNLEYVCKNCHEIIHGHCGSEKNSSRVWFDANGDAHEAPLKKA